VRNIDEKIESDLKYMLNIIVVTFASAFVNKKLSQFANKKVSQY